jgi:glycerate kinase
MRETMPIRILIAPSGFKESLGAEEVAGCIEAGILSAMPDAVVKKAPLADGGEGFTRALLTATGGEIHYIEVAGPTGLPVQAHYGFLGGAHKAKTAVLEMATAAGLRLVPRNHRNPLQTTTYGVGELIKAALDAGAQKLLIGCGDSGTSDGGCGMAQALGVRFLDARGRELGRGGGELSRLDHIDLTGRDPRLKKVRIDVACNWHNVLCGPEGVAHVFGPQKGATPEMVARLSESLEHFADVIALKLDIDVRQMPGGGASGGLGAGLNAFLGARLHSRYDIIFQYLDIDSLLKESDLVITAEGALDYQTPRGKIPAEVARRAKLHQLPVIALAGTIGLNARTHLSCGIDSYACILEEPCALEKAIQNAPDLLTRTAESVMRTILIGKKFKL